MPDPIQKTSASFPFVGSSLDLKTAEAIVGPNKFLVLENCSTVETSTGSQLQQRNGSEPLTMLDTDGNAVSGGTALSVFTTPSSSELDYIGNGYLYSYSSVIDRWVKKGVLPAITEAERNIARGGYGKGNPSSAITGDVGLYAWEDAQGGVWYTVIDEVTGTVYQNNTQVSATAAVPKVLVFNSKLHLFVEDMGSLVHYEVNPTTPTTFSGSTVIQTGLVSVNPSFDVVPNNSTVGIAYVATGSVLGLMTINQVTLATTQSTVTAQAAVGVWVANLASTSLACIIAVGTGMGVAFNFYSLSGLSLVNSFTDAASDTIELATAIQLTNSSILCYFQTAPTTTVDRIIVTAQVDSGTGIVASATFARGVGLASGIIVQDGIPYVLTVFTSAVQQTAFVMRSVNAAPGTVVGKFFPLQAGPFPVSLTGTYGRVPLWSSTSSGVYELATTQFTAITSVNGTPTPINGVTELTLDFTQMPVHGVELGSALHFSGALPQFYDGQNVAEENFNVYPEQVTLTQLASNIGVITTTDGSSNSNPSTAAQVVQIIFPQVPGSSGTNTTPPADASLIIPGEWITFGGNIAGSENTNATAGSAFYVWFSVDGEGNDPGMGGSVFSGKGMEIAVNSTDTCFQIAQNFYNTVNETGATGYAKISGLYTFTLPASPGNTVTATAATVISPSIPAMTYRSRPASGTKFVVNQVDDGTTIGPQGICCISACPGNLITAGQYFTLTITNATSTSDVPSYAWFQVDGVGTDPTPSGFSTVGGAITVLSTDSAFDVAAKITTQLPILVNATFGAAVMSAFSTGTGPQVSVFNNFALASSPMTPANFAQNPYNGGVGFGYLGQNINTTLGTAGSVLAYQWSDIYEAIDNQGQLHLSQPGEPQTGYVASYGVPGLYPGAPAPTLVPGTGAFTVTSKTLRLTSRPTVDIAIYRTQGDGDQFQRTTSPVTPLFNVPTQDYLTYKDTTPDTTLAGNEIMYSQAVNGIVPNSPPPASAFVTTHQGRVLYCNCENRQQLIYTGAYSNGFGMAGSVEFSPIQIDPVWGPIIGACSMDGNLIVFTESQCWIVGGTGPNQLNQGGYSTPQIINSTVGCRDPGSIALMPMGIVFKSLKGVYLIDRKLNAQYIGQAIEGLNDDVVTSTTVVNDSTQSRLGSATGTPVVWDYGEQQWATSTGVQSNDSLLYNGTYYYLRTSDGAVMQEIPGLYADDGVAFTMKVRTWWIKPGNLIKGESRVWAWFVKGYFPGTNAIRVDLAIDYDGNTIVDSKDLFPGAGTNTSIWGGDAHWGDSSPWGGPSSAVQDPLLQFRYQPQQQLAEAYQLTFYGIEPFPTDVSWGLDALELEFGQVSGGRRLPQGSSI